MELEKWKLNQVHVMMLHSCGKHDRNPFLMQIQPQLQQNDIVTLNRNTHTYNTFLSVKKQKKLSLSLKRKMISHILMKNVFTDDAKNITK